MNERQAQCPITTTDAAVPAQDQLRDGSFALDVSRGLPVGFSLTPGDHRRLVIRDSDPTR
jgi:hypothetical protein